MAHRCIRLILNVHEWSWMIMHESRTAHLDNSMWMLVTLSFALLCCAWSTSDGDVPGWSECCCRDVWLGGHGKILQSDDSLIVLIPCWFPTVCQSLRVMSKLFMMQVTWPPPQTNERVGGYEFLGGEAEAKQIDEINDFWYLLLIEVFSIYCLQDFGSIFFVILLMVFHFFAELCDFVSFWILPMLSWFCPLQYIQCNWV